MRSDADQARVETLSEPNSDEIRRALRRLRVNAIFFNLQVAPIVILAMVYQIASRWFGFAILVLGNVGLLVQRRRIRAGELPPPPAEARRNEPMRPVRWRWIAKWFLIFTSPIWLLVAAMLAVAAVEFVSS